jgi:hypothetical protein
MHNLSVLVFILVYDHTASTDIVTFVLIHELLQVFEILEFFLVDTVFPQIKGYLKIIFLFIQT